VQNDIPFTPDDQPATPEDTVAWLVKRAHRKGGHVGVRKAFLQQGRGRRTRPGPLAALVTNGDHRALCLYLHARLVASAEPWDVTLRSDTWVRMVAQEKDRSPASARSLVSKAWARLEDAQLVRRERVGRRSSVILLHESGSGDDYAEPDGTSADLYFRIPVAFWLDGWHHKLSLPGLAMLLVALDADVQFWLPAEKVQAWYGFSASTANRGYAELEEHGLLTVRNRRVKDPQSINGLQIRLERRLTGDFAKPLRPTRRKSTSASNVLTFPSVDHVDLDADSAADVE
jgi:hypothetical protein